MPTIWHYTEPHVVSQKRYDQLLPREDWFAVSTPRPDPKPGTGPGGSGNSPVVELISYVANKATAGDGVTDHTSAIAAAIAALPASGGIVQFGPGTWISSSVEVKSNVTYRGMGPGATSVKLKANTNNSLFKTTGFDTLTGTDNTVTPYSFSIRDMTIDGNKSQQTSGTSHGVAIYGCGYNLTNFKIINCRSQGLWTEWATTTPPAESQVGGSMEAMVTDFYIIGCDGGAIMHQGPHDTQFNNGFLTRNCSSQVTGIVIDMPVDGRANGSTFSNLHIWGALNAYGARCNSSGIGFYDCQIEGSMVAQVRYGASLNQWQGGKLFAGYTPAQASVAFMVDSGVNNLDVDCRVENLTGGIWANQASGGNHRVRIHATYTGGVSVPTAASANVDNNSAYDILVINNSGSMDAISIFRRGVVQFKKDYMSVGPTANAQIALFIKSQADNQRGMLFAKSSTSQTADIISMQDDSFVDLFRFDRWGRPIAAGANVGIAIGSATSAAVAGARLAKDAAGHVTATALASPVAGVVATVTFANTYSAAPKAVVITPNNAATVAAGLYVSSTATSNFVVSCANAPAASAALDFGYHVIG